MEAKPPFTTSCPRMVACFFLDPDYISKHRGSLADNYDEFVGELFDDGLGIINTGWLKPAYGNQNLIRTLDPDFGERRW